MNASYSIPETAKLTGIPEHAIREYAKQFADVLPPPEAPGDGGRAAVKRYPDSALAIFRSIRKLKDEGLDTAQIRSALQEPTPYGAITEWDNIALATAADAAPSATETDEATTEEWHSATAETSAEEWHGDTAEISAEEWHTGEAVAAPTEEASAEVDAGTASADTAATEWEAADSETTAEASGEISVVTYDSEYDAPAEVELYTPAAEAPADGTVEASTESETEAEQAAGEKVAIAATDVTESPDVLEAVSEESPEPSTIHPLFTNLNEGLHQLRKIMDENTHQRESLRAERELLLAETTAKKTEIEGLKTTVAAQEEKIGSLQSALNVLMSQCDQQLQAIRSALGQG